MALNITNIEIAQYNYLLPTKLGYNASVQCFPKFYVNNSQSISTIKMRTQYMPNHAKTHSPKLRSISPNGGSLAGFRTIPSVKVHGTVHIPQ